MIWLRASLDKQAYNVLVVCPGAHLQLGGTLRTTLGRTSRPKVWFLLTLVQGFHVRSPRFLLYLDTNFDFNLLKVCLVSRRILTSISEICGKANFL
jgi:hypothetical protein